MDGSVMNRSAMVFGTLRRLLIVVLVVLAGFPVYWMASTALSTMPSTSCSADPPQKRSMMPFTARTATFCRASDAL